MTNLKAKKADFIHYLFSYFELSEVRPSFWVGIGVISDVVDDWKVGKPELWVDGTNRYYDVLVHILNAVFF